VLEIGKRKRQQKEEDGHTDLGSLISLLFSFFHGQISFPVLPLQVSSEQKVGTLNAHT
jgi:hypothetical protein